MDMSLAGMVPALMLGMAFAKVGRESLRGPALLPAYELGGGGGGAPQVAFGPGAVSCTALSANRRFFSIEIIRISAIIHPVRLTGITHRGIYAGPGDSEAFAARPCQP